MLKQIFKFQTKSLPYDSIIGFWQKEFGRIYSSKWMNIYRSRRTYIHNADGHNFFYSYVVEITRNEDCAYVHLSLVISPNSINKEVMNELMDMCGTIKKDDIGYLEIYMQSMYHIQFCHDVFSKDVKDEDIMTTIGSLLHVIDCSRYYFLEKKWNKNGNNGWDIIEAALYNKDIFNK